MSVKQHNFTFRLDNNTHHPALAVVDDLLHGVLEFGLAFFADGGDFGADAVLDELFDGFAEDVGFPDAFAALATLADVLDEVVGLLLGAYDRGDLGFDVCLDHVDGRALGADFYSEFVTLADDGRVFDLDLGKFRNDDAVAGRADGFEGCLNFDVLLFHGCQFFHGVDQVVLAFHGDAAHFA